LRFSSESMQMWTHYDINDNLLSAIKGRKRLILWHPLELKHLYHNVSASAVVDVENPDLNRFPEFKHAWEVRWEGFLEQGDILFIPAMWWHNVRSLTPCYGLNVFWRHLPRDMYQVNDLYGNKDLVAAQTAQKAFMKAKEALASLPEEYQKFFIQKLLIEFSQETPK